MKALRNTPISRQLTLLVLAAVAVALLLSCVAFVANDLVFMRSAMVQQLTALADVLGANTEAALKSGDSKSARRVLVSLMGQPSVRLACIYDAEGHVFASYSLGAIPQAFPPAPASAGHRFTPDGYLDVAERIVADGETIGTIYLHTALDQVRQQLARYGAIVGAVLAVSFAASYLLASRLQRRILGPILTLATTAQRIAVEQDYSLRVERPGDDEIGTLYDNFNHMLEQVESGKRELQEAHRKLERQSQERMKAIVETAADAIITFTEDGLIESCNGASCELFGYRREELIGGVFANLLADTKGHRWRDYLSLTEDAGSPRHHAAREIDARRKDGEVIPLLASLSRIMTDSGWVCTAILRDLSEYKKLQRELNQAQRLESIGQLAAGIAHEINTPMQFVSDNIEYLNQCTAQLFEVVQAYERNLVVTSTPRPWQERMQEIRDIVARSKFDRIREQVPLAIAESLEGIERVKHIVRAMKEFSHPGGGNRAPTDLNQALESTATITRNRWKYVADLELELDSDLPSVWCYPAEMNQVFLNLVVNAADAIADKVGESGEEKGRITVRSRVEGHNAVIEVEDTGCGIPEEIRNRIFDPFFTTKEVGKGTGQGLAICYNVVVNKHRGTIEVESTPGVGSVFRVRIPRGRKEESATRETAAALADASR